MSLPSQYTSLMINSVWHSQCANTTAIIAQPITGEIEVELPCHSIDHYTYKDGYHRRTVDPSSARDSRFIIPRSTGVQVQNHSQDLQSGSRIWFQHLDPRSGFKIWFQDLDPRSRGSWWGIVRSGPSSQTRGDDTWCTCRTLRWRLVSICFPLLSQQLPRTVLYLFISELNWIK